MTYYERKAVLPHGAASRVAEKLGLSLSRVSKVLSGALRDRAVEQELAKCMRTELGRRVTVTEAFGHAALKFHRKGLVSVSA